MEKSFHTTLLLSIIFKVYCLKVRSALFFFSETLITNKIKKVLCRMADLFTDFKTHLFPLARSIKMKRKLLSFDGCFEFLFFVLP